MRKWMPFLAAFYMIFHLGPDTFAQGVGPPRSPCGPIFPSDASLEWDCYRVKKGETPETLFGEYWEAVLRFNRIDRRHVWPGKYLKTPRDLNAALNFNPMPQALERAASNKKYILIDLAGQFLGAYEWGKLQFALPIASGRGYSTPKGIFRVLARDRYHRSSLYTIQGTSIPYPMYWGIHFYTSKKGVRFWIHSRDIPGYPASHGCIGLYDEEMQRQFYGSPQDPKLNDAKRLYLWLFPDGESDEKPIAYQKDAPVIPIEII